MVWWFWLKMERFTGLVIFSIKLGKTFVKIFLLLQNTFFHLHKTQYFDLNKFTNGEFPVCRLIK